MQKACTECDCGYAVVEPGRLEFCCALVVGWEDCMSPAYVELSDRIDTLRCFMAAKPTEPEI